MKFFFVKIGDPYPLRVLSTLESTYVRICPYVRDSLHMSKYVHMLSVTNIWTGLAHTQGRTFKLVFKLEFEYSQFQKTWSSSEFTFPLYCDNYYSSLGFRTVHVCPVQISPLRLYEFEYWIYYTHSHSYSDSTSACPPPP